LTQKSKKDRRRRGGYRRRFEYSDLAWLTEQFQKQAALNADLTLEEFAIRHGVLPDVISYFIKEGRERWKPAKARKRNQKSKIGHRMHFESADFACLAKEYQKQTTLTPDLTLEEFAIRHGVKPKWISRFMGMGENTVALWHGTTEDRTRAIVEQGFRGLGRRALVWFTRNSKFALRVANARAAARHKIPVVISCEINLEKYSAFQKANSQTYVFSSPIGKEVICNVSVVKKDWVFNNPSVQVTKTAGKMDILSWINWYLGMGSEAAIGKDHPAVEAIFKWVKAQHAQGRESLISDEEMSSMVMIIRSIPGLGMGKELPEEEEEEDELVDVVITKNAGKLGVLYWINRYLELTDGAAISEDHPAVESIFEWVKAQYVEGREEPISDGEMLMQVLAYLKED